MWSRWTIRCLWRTPRWNSNNPPQTCSRSGQFLTFATLADIDHLITDEGIPNAYRAACREHNIHLTTV